jgi:hypothetical protein
VSTEEDESTLLVAAAKRPVNKQKTLYMLLSATTGEDQENMALCLRNCYGNKIRKGFFVVIKYF